MATYLGIYTDTAALDHDTTMLLEVVLTELQSRGVASQTALAAIRRCVATFYRG